MSNHIGRISYVVNTTLRRVKAFIPSSQETEYVLQEQEEIVHLPKLVKSWDILLQSADCENHIITQNIDGTLDFPTEHYDKRTIERINRDILKYKDEN